MVQQTKMVIVRAESHVIIDKSRATTAAWATRRAVEYVKRRERIRTLTGLAYLYDEYKIEGKPVDKGDYWEVLVVGEKKLDVSVPPDWVEVKSGVLAGRDEPGV